MRVLGPRNLFVAIINPLARDDSKGSVIFTLMLHYDHTLCHKVGFLIPMRDTIDSVPRTLHGG